MRCKPLSPAVLAQAYRNACLAELQAIKPGNVHVFADGHCMTVHDFIKSADATAELISQAGLTVGERILQAVKATQSAVGMNTNLGLILLCAPLIHAALSPASELDLAQNLARVLDELSVVDGALTAQAIVLAKPAGLGTASQHDVQAEVGINLKQLMLAAADRDHIAWQYANNYDTIFCLALPRFLNAKQAWQDQAKLNSEAWATTAVYLALLARHPDSHIVRKHGMDIAQAICLEAQAIEADYLKTDNPKLMQTPLLRWDAALKRRDINPGTSADLTVASLLAYQLQLLSAAQA